MTAMTDEKRVSDDKLREIIAGCDGVTPGPWTHGYWSGQCHKNHAHTGPRGLDPCVYDYTISEGSNGVAANSQQQVEVLGSDYDGLVATPVDLSHIARLDPETVAAICSELLARRSQEPDGWRLVPVEPTEEMIEAHFAAHAAASTVFADVPAIWAAMLAAAPSPKEGK